jgi:hypothetical protein
MQSRGDPALAPGSKAAAILVATMPKSEQERLLSRIAEIEAALRQTRSEDVREVMLAAIAECRGRLAALEASTSARESALEPAR